MDPITFLVFILIVLVVIGVLAKRIDWFHAAVGVILIVMSWYLLVNWPRI